MSNVDLQKCNKICLTKVEYCYNQIIILQYYCYNRFISHSIVQSASPSAQPTKTHLRIEKKMAQIEKLYI